MAALALVRVDGLELSLTNRGQLRAAVTVTLLGALMDTNADNVFTTMVEGLDPAVTRVLRDAAIAEAVKAELPRRGITVDLTDTVAVQ
jgi:hypothetical protein